MAKKTAASGHRGIYRSGSTPGGFRVAWSRPRDFDRRRKQALFATAGTVRGIFLWRQPGIIRAGPHPFHSLLRPRATVRVADAGVVTVETFPFRNCRRPLPSLSPTSTSRRRARTLDGYMLQTNDIRSCSLPESTTSQQNGVWTWNGSTLALTRPHEFPTGGAVKRGRTCLVVHGTVPTLSNTIWALTATAICGFYDSTHNGADVGAGVEWSPRRHKNLRDLEGAAGSQGSQGLEGTQGPQGQTGSQGTQGNQGIRFH